MKGQVLKDRNKINRTSYEAYLEGYKQYKAEKAQAKKAKAKAQDVAKDKM